MRPRQLKKRNTRRETKIKIEEEIKGKKIRICAVTINLKKAEIIGSALIMIILISQPIKLSSNMVLASTKVGTGQNSKTRRKRQNKKRRPTMKSCHLLPLLNHLVLEINLMMILEMPECITGTKEVVLKVEETTTRIGNAPTPMNSSNTLKGKLLTLLRMAPNSKITISNEAKIKTGETTIIATIVVVTSKGRILGKIIKKRTKKMVLPVLRKCPTVNNKIDRTTEEGGRTTTITEGITIITEVVVALCKAATLIATTIISKWKQMMIKIKITPRPSARNPKEVDVVAEVEAVAVKTTTTTEEVSRDTKTIVMVETSKDRVVTAHKLRSTKTNNIDPKTTKMMEVKRLVRVNTTVTTKTISPLRIKNRMLTN